MEQKKECLRKLWKNVWIKLGQSPHIVQQGPWISAEEVKDRRYIKEAEQGE